MDDRQFLEPYGAVVEKLSTAEAQRDKWKRLALSLAHELDELKRGAPPPNDGLTTVERVVLRATEPAEGGA